MLIVEIKKEIGEVENNTKGSADGNVSTQNLRCCKQRAIATFFVSKIAIFSRFRSDSLAL